MVPQLSTRRPDSAGTAAAIACAGLTKDHGGGYGEFGLDPTARHSGTFGLIGPNGARIAALAQRFDLDLGRTRKAAT